MTYEVVKIVGQENKPNVTREQTLVKIEPILCRAEKSYDLYEIDHVLIEAMRITDEASGRAYEETQIVASDEEGNSYPSTVWRAPRALTVEEAVFGIGQHNWVEHPENDYIADTDNEGGE